MSLADLDIIIQPSEDVIDLYFIQTDLNDINLTDAEICQTAFYDSMASASVSESEGDSGVPVGKRVL